MYNRDRKEEENTKSLILAQQWVNKYFFFHSEINS